MMHVLIKLLVEVISKCAGISNHVVHFTFITVLFVNYLNKTGKIKFLPLKCKFPWENQKVHLCEVNVVGFLLIPGWNKLTEEIALLTDLLGAFWEGQVWMICSRSHMRKLSFEIKMTGGPLEGEAKIAGRRMSIGLLYLFTDSEPVTKHEKNRGFQLQSTKHTKRWKRVSAKLFLSPLPPY